MMTRRLAVLFFLVCPLLHLPALAAAARGRGDPRPPASSVKLIFIHHSTGENWLSDGNGRLGLILRANNYFVSDTNYGWGPETIGDRTDIGHWWTWFCGPKRAAYTAALFKESRRSSDYSRLPKDPGGENTIIMFKSCFPNSHLRGRPDDPPTSGNNPLRGQDAGSVFMTVGNVKGIYNDLLSYFASRRDKLFIVVTAPPLTSSSTTAACAGNARAVNDWLVEEWLKPYPYPNVAVFDFFNVLTSNGGGADVNDLGWATGNHHRWQNGLVEHIQTLANDYSAYGSSPEDSHPTAAGGIKAGSEFAGLLNVYVSMWKTGPQAPRAGTVSPSSGTVAAGAPRLFTATISDPNGRSDIARCYFLVGPETLEAAAAVLEYDPLGNRLYVRSDDGKRLLGGFAPGSAKVIQSGRVRLDCAKTSVSGQGNIISVRWSVTFKAKLAGGQDLYLKATDRGGLSSGWKKKGKITILS